MKIEIIFYLLRSLNWLIRVRRVKTHARQLKRRDRVMPVGAKKHKEILSLQYCNWSLCLFTGIILGIHLLYTLI